MVCPGDMVTSMEGWDGLPIFDQCYDDHASRRTGVFGRTGALGSRDIALALAVSGSFILIITQRMELGWVHRDCLVKVDRFRTNRCRDSSTTR